MRIFLAAMVLLVTSCAGSSQVRNQADAVKVIGPDAVWHPPASFRERVMEKCSSATVQDISGCFISVMKDSKASPEAVAFAGKSGNMAHLRGFRSAGTVDIAFVEYPFRANENYACALVNGDPAVIDVDDYAIVQKVDLKNDKTFTEIASTFPKAELWPGDRFGADCIVPEAAPGGMQRFLVTYRLLNGCHACEVLGLAKVSFDFDNKGKFIGTELLTVEASIDLFSDPGQTLNVSAGRKFALVLESNHATGYRWELLSSGDSAIVKSVGNEYSAPATGLAGAGGKEVWIFEAVGKGATGISLKYARPWEKDVPTVKTVTFRVSVEAE